MTLKEEEEEEVIMGNDGAGQEGQEMGEREDYAPIRVAPVPWAFGFPPVSSRKESMDMLFSDFAHFIF